MAGHVNADRPPEVHAGLPGTSGDPLLKRLVELAQLGWQARLIVLSNGQYIEGTLVSGKAFRTALASEIRIGSDTRAGALYETLDSMVAAAVDAEDPGPSDLGAPSDIPEPRFIHLARVVIGHPDEAIRLPFLRLRLPAVSGFWVTRIDGEVGAAR